MMMLISYYSLLDDDVSLDDELDDDVVSSEEVLDDGVVVVSLVFSVSEVSFVDLVLSFLLVFEYVPST